MLVVVLLALLVAAPGLARATSCGCDFADDLSLEDDTFVSCMALREGRFLRVGLGSSEMTRDGAFISQETGEVLAVHDFSAPSKESVHLALIALAIEGNKDAQRVAALRN